VYCISAMSIRKPQSVSINSAPALSAATCPTRTRSGVPIPALRQHVRRRAVPRTAASTSAGNPIGADLLHKAVGAYFAIRKTAARHKPIDQVNDQANRPARHTTNTPHDHPPTLPASSWGKPYLSQDAIPGRNPDSHPCDNVKHSAGLAVSVTEPECREKMLTGSTDGHASM
jgi:hypothetical protein